MSGAKDLEELMSKENFELRLRVEAQLKKKPLVFDSNGHCAKAPRELLWILEAQEGGHLPNLFEALQSKAPLTTPLILGEASVLNRCAYCGEWLQLATDGRRLFPSTPCSYPDGVPLSFELNVPSGVMVVGNDFREHFKVFGNYEVNTPLGCDQTTHAMAAIGCAHAFVGNSSPGMYRTGPDQFTIATEGYDDRSEKTRKPQGKQVASIDTDLWWYSIVDEDEFKRRGYKKGDYDVDRVKVTPGVYTFTHHAHMKSFDRSSSRPTIYTTIVWTRPPDPVKDYKKEAVSRNFTAGQVIANSMRRYPTLYNGLDAVQGVADHIFCVIGGGGSWHANGFVQYDPDMRADDPAVEIPVFNKKYQWYPLCEFSALWRAAGLGGGTALHLNPSFLALARNVSQCIITYGSEGSPQNVKIAVRCLKALNAKYPIAKTAKRKT